MEVVALSVKLTLGEVALLEEPLFDIRCRAALKSRILSWMVTLLHLNRDRKERGGHAAIAPG
jgi:hypothetical protein